MENKYIRYDGVMSALSIMMELLESLGECQARNQIVNACVNRIKNMPASHVVEIDECAYRGLKCNIDTCPHSSECPGYIKYKSYGE